MNEFDQRPPVTVWTIAWGVLWGNLLTAAVAFCVGAMLGLLQVMR